MPAARNLDRISMLDWLLQKRQTPRAIDRFWRQILVSAVNEDLDRMAAVHGFQVFWLGFWRAPIPTRWESPPFPWPNSYAADAWERLANVRFHLRSPVERIDGSVSWWAGERRTPIATSARCLSSALKPSASRPPLSSTHPSPACTCGSTARSPRCRMPPCSAAPCSGCSIRIAAVTCTGGQRLARVDQPSAQ